MITVIAPAKLNLTLEILGKRPDDYHEIRSVMQSVSLCDTLYFAPARDTSITGDMPDWRADLSLIAKAVKLVRETTGSTLGIDIKVEKRIPLMSGLGGDSSDAAATLLGLNRVWSLGLSQEQMCHIAARLGSDVPFFLRGGTVLAAGRGELLTALPDMDRAWFLITVPPIPPVPGKTARMYTALTPEHYTDGRFTEQLVSRLKAYGPVSWDLIFNTFESVAYGVFSGLDAWRDRLRDHGADNVNLAGAGPGLFTFFNDREQAEDVWRHSQDSCLGVWLTESIPAER